MVECPVCNRMRFLSRGTFVVTWFIKLVAEHFFCILNSFVFTGSVSYWDLLSLIRAVTLREIRVQWSG